MQLRRQALASGLTVALSLAAAPAPGIAQSACSTDRVAASAVVREATVACGVQVDANARIILADIEGRSRIGERSLVLGGRVIDSIVQRDAQIVATTLRSANVGIATVVAPGSDISFAQIGERSRIERGAKITGGPGSDFVFIGSGVTIEEGAEVFIRRLGDGSRIGRDATISDSTEAAARLNFGDRSTWGPGGDAGDDVTVGRDVSIEGGVTLQAGVTIGDSVSIGVLVEVRPFTQIYRDAVIENNATIGFATLIGRGAIVGSGATVGNNVFARRGVRIGDNASIGDDVVLDVGAVVPVGATVPPASFVRSDGVVEPL